MMKTVKLRHYTLSTETEEPVLELREHEQIIDASGSLVGGKPTFVVVTAEQQPRKTTTRRP
jgi:hypothetical protein